VKNNLILNRFFSKKMLDNLLSKSDTRLFNTVIRRYVKEPNGKQYSQLISEVYAYINKEYRNEYFYKNTLINKLLFKKHNYLKTAVLTELPIAKSKADFIMINGKGVVYEIKTELDNLDRILNQVDDYYKAFSEVVIVTHSANIERICDILPEYVGIIELTKRGALKTFRNSIKHSENLDYNVIFKILRKTEFESILCKRNKQLPIISEFKYYKESLELIKEIDINELQMEMLKQLKTRTNIETVEFSLEFSEELRFLLYFHQGAVKNKDEVRKLLNQNYGG